MILFINQPSNIITAYHTTATIEDLPKYPRGVWYDGEFSFFMGEDIDGKRKVFKFIDGEVVIEYEDLPEPIEPEPTQLDRIETAINLSQQEIIDNYTLELIEGGVI